MQRYTIEYGGIKQKYLIVDAVGTPYTLAIKKILSTYDAEVYVSPVTPPNLQQFQVCFFINPKDEILNHIADSPQTKKLFIVIQNRSRAEKMADYLKKENKTDIRVINAIRGLPEKEDLEKILWFAAEPGHEWMLTIYNYLDTTTLSRPIKETRKKISKFGLLIVASISLILAHFIFLIPLSISTYYVYNGLKAIQMGEIDKSQSYIESIDTSLKVGTFFYSFSRPTLLFFSMAEIPDNIILLNETGKVLIEEVSPFIKDARSFASLLLKKEGDELDMEILKRQKDNLIKETSLIHRDMLTLYQKIPEWNDDLIRYKRKLGSLIETMDLSEKILPHLDQLLAAEREKKYLLLFANNMELRPGGGFIGSFGILKVEKLGLKSITIYDVYDADGQLNAHIAPPDPIRDYLHQPHWFLRDSAFSPDFHENYLAATKFLEREMGFSGFDGGILITTSAIQTILEGVGQIYVPEYKETINKDNFYLKAQLYAEKDFFPGSIQKKSFLSAVADSLIVQLEDNPSLDILKSIYTALNEKQIALNFEDESLQTMSDSLYWTGRLITPSCTFDDTACVNDYIFPYDANLGVNKANFYINQSTSLHINFLENGDVGSSLMVNIRNNSPNDLFPGGIYKNYFQTLLPDDAQVQSIYIDNQKVDSYQESVERYRKIGIYLEIPHATAKTIKINYIRPAVVVKGKSVYQLVLQKQLGSPDYDFELSLRLPKDIFILNKNFSALVKDSAILYNTSIKADKIFLIELMRN